ncbi:hypothetical protein A1O7_02953, partial [Cladophialophora yegresii CBS 114405]
SNKVKSAANGFLIARGKDEEEAIRVLEEIQGEVDKNADEAVAEQVKNVEVTPANKTGIRANSRFENLGSTTKGSRRVGWHAATDC